jgi:ribosomal-protein-alanine N-acetyltransferase
MSNRKIYIKNDIISLAECLPEDDREGYNDWLDEETQRGYNHKFNQTFEEYSEQGFAPLFEAAVILNENNALIGAISVSAANPLEVPDLAIRIFKPYRSKGYGTAAFALSAQYCFDVLGLDKIYAGCYPDNIRSMKMLKNCGFIPHPEGNIEETHYITGEPVTQLDFVLAKERFSEKFNRISED